MNSYQMVLHRPVETAPFSGVKRIRSEGVFADPVLGNVIEHVAAETDAGKIIYIGTRLKSEFEIVSHILREVTVTGLRLKCP